MVGWVPGDAPADAIRVGEFFVDYDGDLCMATDDGRVVIAGDDPGIVVSGGELRARRLRVRIEVLGFDEAES